MKVLVIGDKARSDKYLPDLEITKTAERIFVDRGATDEEKISAGKEAEVIIADAMATVSKGVIEGIPKLKLIHSEGVGFNGFDVQVAKLHGIPVCNCKGANAGAVAEQTIMLMIAVLRDVVGGHEAVKNGRQIQVKEQKMVSGISEISDGTIGLIGFGDIAKAVAKRLKSFGCTVKYYNRTRQSEKVEEEYGVSYVSLEELAQTCDIISLHVAVTEDTRGMIDEKFLNMMKNTAFLINTARGDLVDNQAVATALSENSIAGAAFDTIYPEPTLTDNPLLNIASTSKATVLYSPHIGGITTSSFMRCHKLVWENIDRLNKGKTLVNIVNL